MRRSVDFRTPLQKAAGELRDELHSWLEMAVGKGALIPQEACLRLWTQLDALEDALEQEVAGPTRAQTVGEMEEFEDATR